MATLEALAARKLIERMEVPLVGRQQPLRRLYVTPGFKVWAQTELKAIVATEWGGDIPPTLQVVTLLRRFRAGEVLHFNRQFNILRPEADGVWELKTGDVRLFGWFPEIDCFVASVGADANYLKALPKERYAECCSKVITERNAIDLDPPKYITSEKPADVISV